MLWQQIEAAGFLDLLLGEGQGGAGMPLPELFPILECLGRFAVPLPIAQSIVARALVGGRATLPGGMLTVASRLRRTVGSGLVCHMVPCGAVADHVLVCEDDQLLLLPCASARRDPVGDPRGLGATLVWRTSEPVFHLTDGGNDLQAFCPAMAAALLSGAMQRSFEMALDHCNTRVQFGRSIGKFQAIQQQLSLMAEHVAAAAIAAESAFQSAGSAPTLLAAAIAKSRTSEAAGLVAATTHALHGAIGMTDEYDLGILTRRLHEWRLDYGAEQHWNQTIGAQLLACASGVVDFVRTV